MIEVEASGRQLWEERGRGVHRGEVLGGGSWVDKGRGVVERG